MPITKSELMYLSLGLAVGGAVGANWKKVKPMLEGLLGPAAEGFSDAYGGLMQKFASQAESFQDSAAEQRHEKKANKKKKKAKKKSKNPVVPVGQHVGSFGSN